MKYFIDTEFKEKPHTIDLISIGIVCEDGREYFALSKDFNLKEVWKDEWIRENVLQSIYIKYIHGDMRNYALFTKRSIQGILNSFGKTNNSIAEEIKIFVDNNPVFYGYYADYDWVVFCWLFGRMIDLPNGYPMYCRDLKQMMDDKELTEEWKQLNCPNPEGEHNALVDARWNYKLYQTIINTPIKKKKS